MKQSTEGIISVHVGWSIRRASALITVILLLPMLWIADAYGGEVSGEQFSRKYDLPRDPQPVLRQILDRTEFKVQEGESLIEWLRWWLWELLRRAIVWIFDRPWGEQGGRLASTTVPLVVDALLVGIVAVIAIAIAWGLVKYLLRLGGGQSRDIVAGAESENELIDSARARYLAASLADQGKYCEAVIYTFRFVLLFLDETGRVPIAPGKTNREILAGIAVDRPEYEALAQMAPVFNAVRYGDVPCQQVDYERFVLLSRRVTQETGTP